MTGEIREGRLQIFRYIKRDSCTPYYVAFLDHRRFFVIPCGELRGKVERLPNGHTLRRGILYYLFKGKYRMSNDAIFIGE